MSNGEGLPKGWASARLDEVADISSNRKVADLLPETPVTFVPMAAVREEFGGIDVSALRPYCEVQKGYTQFREGDVLLAKITPCMENGKVAVVPRLVNECGYGSTEFHVLRPRSCIAPDWIAHYVSQKGFRREAQRNMTGSAGQLRVPKHWLQEQYIPVAPSSEQRRIVAKIEELFSDLDAGVAALERVKAKLKRYRAAVLKAAVEGKLTEAWRQKNRPKETGRQLLDRILQERRCKWEKEQIAAYEKAGRKPPAGWKDKYKEPTGPDESGLPELPDGWCWASVAQVAEVQGGIQKQPKRRPAQNDYPYLRVANVYRNRLDLSEVHKIELFGDELERLRLRAGDLLIVEGNGSITEIGRSALWQDGIENCVHQNHIIRVRFLAGHPGYLNAFWNSPTGNARVMESAASTSGLYTLSVAKVSSLPVPIAPVCEQEQIIAEVDRCLSIIEEAASQITANLKRSARLRQSILKRAFEGKLVPQDSNDEPASVLLERIKATKDNGSPKTTRPARKTK
jgi:type I restriction enzyme S subunit